MPEGIEVKTDVHEAIKQLRETVEKNVLNGLDKEKVAKIEADLDKQEKTNQETTLKIQQLENEKKDIADKYDVLEKRLSRLPSGSEEKQIASEKKKAFEKWLKFGDKNLTADELKYIRTDNDPQGGYFYPFEVSAEINKNITEISPIRQLARVRTVNAPGDTSFKRDTLVSTYWTGEGEAFTESQSLYGKLDIPIHGITAKVRMTTKALMSPIFNMENEINADVTESLAQKEGAAFVSGNGVKKPEGFMFNTDVASINSGDASAITFDNIIDLAGALKTGYSPVYLMNRTTVAYVQKLKSSTGAYLWQAGNVAGGVPNRINGYPYVEVPDMDNVSAGLYPVAFGDLRRSYLIIDGVLMTVLRNPWREDGFVHFTTEKFTGGLVVLPEAIKKLKVST